jgi:hypothetical protein
MIVRPGVVPQSLAGAPRSGPVEPGEARAWQLGAKNPRPGRTRTGEKRRARAWGAMKARQTTLCKNCSQMPAGGRGLPPANEKPPALRTSRPQAVRGGIEKDPHQSAGGFFTPAQSAQNALAQVRNE